jgi:hypothetical protein
MQPPRYSRVLAKIGAGRGQLINESKIKSLVHNHLALCARKHYNEMLAIHQT